MVGEGREDLRVPGPPPLSWKKGGRSPNFQRAKDDFWGEEGRVKEAAGCLLCWPALSSLSSS